MKTYEQLAEAVKQGRTVLIKPFPNTEVTIRSNDYESVKAIVDALEPMPEAVGPEAVESALVQVEMTLAFLNDGETRPVVKEFITRLYNTYG